jgi:hypothetical protein
VRIVFSFAAVTASEESEDNVSFNPQTMHAGADLAACCATVIGRLQNGTVTLQVGGVCFHAVGPLSPGSSMVACAAYIKIIEVAAAPPSLPLRRCCSCENVRLQ